MAPRRILSNTPFDTLEKTFNLLVSGPDPLSLDGSVIDGLPDRVIPLDQLKGMLLHPSTSYEVRDAVINAMATGSRATGGSATIGLAGILLPGLRRAASPMIRAFPDKADDIEAEMLVALLQAVARTGPNRARVAARLTWLAHNGASRHLRHDTAERAGVGTDPVSSAPPRPWGHPDLVLARAVRFGIVALEDAELIAHTRLGDLRLIDAASALGISYRAAQKRRVRAEFALAAWLRSDDYVPFDFVPPKTLAPCSSPGGRPRHGLSLVRSIRGGCAAPKEETNMDRSHQAAPESRPRSSLPQTLTRGRVASACRGQDDKGIGTGVKKSVPGGLRPGSDPPVQPLPARQGDGEGSAATADLRGDRS
jgi:hypothetical protein